MKRGHPSVIVPVLSMASALEVVSTKGNSRATIGGRAKFVTWLYHIALNLCRDHSRSQLYRVSAHMISIDLSVEGKEAKRQLVSNRRGPDKTAENREKLLALEKAIVDLPQGLKSPFILTALEGLSQGKAGQLLGISPKAIETKVYRARKLLLKKMNQMGSRLPHCVRTRCSLRSNDPEIHLFGQILPLP